jgi:hypothetical protein
VVNISCAFLRAAKRLRALRGESHLVFSLSAVAQASLSTSESLLPNHP